MKKIFSVSIATLAVAFSAVQAAPAKQQASVKVGKQNILVEIARSPEEWKKGLMFRDRLAPKEGMLFFGTSERMQSFWMKNTPLSLDMLFIGKDPKKKNKLQVLHIVKNTEPLSEAPISSRKPAIHILEIKGGESDRLKIQIGDPVDLSGIPAPSSH
jgi:uncharacterized membrane protein (UPF0127 family)